MKPGAAWLSSGIETLRADLEKSKGETWDCDVLVIGSGYGGAVAAARLAGRTLRGARARVFVIERGREWLPGTFPTRFAELPGQVRFSLQDGEAPKGVASGLYDVRIGEHVSVLVGNGLGGGSLINAAVMEMPPRQSVVDEVWDGVPDPDRDAAYERAGRMLQSLDNRHPAASTVPSPLRKLRALDRLAEVKSGFPGRTAIRVQLAINFNGRPTPAGVDRRACIGCGDCITGCNWQAKNSLDSNYLALAKRRGASLYTGVLALGIAPDANGGWAVTARPTQMPAGIDATDAAADVLIRARRVIVAAGTLGSTELLLRSFDPARLSRRIGQGFSGNGDSILGVTGHAMQTGISADETVDFDKRDVGPTITGMVEFGNERFVAQEFGIPAPLRRVLAEVTGTFGLLHRLVEGDESDHQAGQAIEDPLAVGEDALSRTMIYGVQGDDGAGGALALVAAGKRWDGCLRIDGEKLRDHEVYERQVERLRAVHRKDPDGLAGTVVPNPSWRPLPEALAREVAFKSGPLVTVHPLGGCCIGSDATRGVVNRLGQVYDPSSGAKSVHPGLAVLDGSIVPRSLGINPALTIAALAEHAVLGLAAEWSFDAEPALPAGPYAQTRWATPEIVPRPRPTEVELVEKLQGRVKIGDTDWWAELEMAFKSGDLLRFVNRHPHTMPAQVAARLKLHADRPRADALEYDPQHEPGPPPPPVHEIPLTTTLSMMDIEDSDTCDRAKRARKWWDKALQGDTGLDPLTRFHLASMVGERRAFSYRLTVGATAGPLQQGDVLIGSKPVQGTPGTSLWRQISVLDLSRATAHGSVPLGRLEVDLDEFAKREAVLVKVVDQQDAPSALMHGGALLLFFVRALAKLHLPNIGLVKDQADHSDERRPRKPKGLKYSYQSLATTTEFALGVARYELEQGAGKQLPPTLLIHGLSANGATFAHDAIPNNLVRTLCDSGRVVWVVELRTSSAHDKSLLKGWSMEEAAADLERVFAHVAKETPGFDRADVVAHCIGSAMFCLAALKDPTLGARYVRKAVLSQVAPVVRLSAMNRFRGFVSSYLVEYLGTATMDTRPTGISGVLQRLVDLLANSFPYPDQDGEFDRLREYQKKHPKADFRTVRHRADAIFGQLFELANLNDETLQVLDAIFGYVHVKTLAQVIQFARWNLLADASGHNDAVSHQKLGEGMHFPILIVHGRENRVFDWRGSRQALQLLRSVFLADPGADGFIPGGHLHWGQNSDRQLIVFDRYGHQDLLIGKEAHVDVFPRLLEFLDQQPSNQARLMPPPVIVCAPWVGPALGDLRWVVPAAGGKPTDRRFKLQLHARPSRQRTVAVVLAVRRAGAWSVALYAYNKADPGEEINFALRARALEIPLVPGNAIDQALADGATLHAFTVHDDLPGSLGTQTWRERPPHPIPPIEIGPQPPARPARLEQNVLSALATLDPRDVDAAQFELGAHVLKAAHQPPTQPPDLLPVAGSLCLALGSCQYPKGLIDGPVAERSYRRLLQRLASEPRPQWLLLLGDQVYVDATGGVFDPVPEAAVIERAYELNRTLSPLRAVQARLPVVQMIDDHEVANGWQPDPSKTPPLAVVIFEAWQNCLNPAAVAGGSRSMRIAPGGWPVFLLDTRSARQRRGPGGSPVADAELVSASDLAALRAWLRDAPKQVPKVIATTVAMLPVERYAQHLETPERLHSDSGSGYPRSQFEVLQAIVDTGAEHVVLVAGDAHLSLAATLQISGGPAVHVVVSSALYAPWPFANQYAPDDLVLAGQVVFKRGGVEIKGGMTTHAIERRDGFAILSAALDLHGGPPRIEVELHRAEDGVATVRRLQ